MISKETFSPSLSWTNEGQRWNKWSGKMPFPQQKKILFSEGCFLSNKSLRGRDEEQHD